MYVQIKSSSSFQKWAEKKIGEYWYKDKKIIKTYGLDQLKKLYPDLY